MALDITYNDIYKRVSDYLRLGYIAVESANATDKARVDSIIQDGLRQFYFRAMLEGESAPHQWTFLTPTGSITLTTNTTAYNLPSDYGSMIGGAMSWAAGENLRPVAFISEERVRHLLDHDNTAAQPVYAGWRTKTLTNPDNKQSFEIVVYPKPSSTYNSKVLTFRYRVEPPSLGGTLGNDSDEYPLGGAVHADAIMQSCLAVAEQRDTNERGPQWTLYQERLAASIAFDRDTGAAILADTYPVETAPSTLDLNYNDFCRNVGQRLGYGMEQGVWNHTQNAIVDQIVNRAYTRFLSPSPADGVRHAWSFLKPYATMTTETTATISATNYNAGTGRTSIVASSPTGPFTEDMVGRDIDAGVGDYEIYSVTSETALVVTGDASGESGTFTIPGCSRLQLPSDFNYFVDRPMYEPDQSVWKGELDEVGEGMIRAKWLKCPSVGSPSMVARRYQASTGTARQRQEALFWPIADAAYELTYRYEAIPSRLTSAAPYPMGNPIHGEAILACCILEATRQLLAEGRADSDALAIAQSEYVERLNASISHDRRMDTPQNIGTMYRNRVLRSEGTYSGPTQIFYNGVEI